VDFLLVVIELFRFSLRRHERISTENRLFRFNGVIFTQNFRYKMSPPTNHSSSQETRLHVLWYGIQISTDLSSVLSQCTRLTNGQRTDRQTDGQQTASFLVVRSRCIMQHGKNGIAGLTEPRDTSDSYRPITCANHYHRLGSSNNLLYKP